MRCALTISPTELWSCLRTYKSGRLGSGSGFIRLKILQSPVIQQLILPRPLVAADADFPIVAANDPSKRTMEEKPSKDVMQSKETPDTARFHRPYPFARTRSLPGCPLCDASVYSYCDEKAYNDACCCGSSNNGPYGGGGAPGGFGGFGGGGGGFGGGFGGGGFGGFNGAGFGSGCGYSGCSQLFANSCYEHQLIVTCCCNSPY
ncbi:translation initiation factor IF-2-like [Anopheles cruzii]|uniref:translation initiation factor IF-2-like n=1 Tax=Anopheles cruzii TaxID=68878 RepID=UPI0022EC9041|nr:translation initiation factor IF-2-like [Anopheles cruzii]